MENWIHDIEIKNFKSIRHQKIEDCRRVNVFIGYPNVGKSNILEAIGLLTFMRKKRPVGLKGLVRLERKTQIFHLSNIKEPATISFNDKFSLYVNYEDEKYVLMKMNISDLQDSRHPAIIHLTSLKVGWEALHSSETGGVDDFSGRVKPNELVNVKPYKFSFEKRFNVSFSALELKVPEGTNLFEVIINNSKLKQEFSQLLSEYGFELFVEPSLNNIAITQSKENGVIYNIPFSLIADTLARLVFFKAAIYSNQNSVLLFEEPEAHMFPPYISKFTTDVMCDDNKNQFFIATHSPFILNDFMETLKKEELAVYVVGFKKETGETTTRRLLDEEVTEIYQYGIDLFFNLENFLKDAV